MKRGGQLLLACLLTALFLVGTSRLVVGEETEREPCSPASTSAQLVMAPAKLEDPPHVCQVRDGTGMPRAALLRCQQFSPLRGQQPVRAGNGWPVTGRSYARTVYVACPLEKRPG